MIYLQIAWVCLKVGALAFGGGMVMVPMLEHDVVLCHQWLTHREFVDAVALGQMTPGPLLVSATFIGYKVAGIPGATLATLCIFLPSFLMTLAASHGLDRFRRNVHVQAFLKGVFPAVVGLIAAAAISIDRTSLADTLTVAIAVAALILLRFKVDAVWIIIGGAAVGLLAYR